MLIFDSKGAIYKNWLPVESILHTIMQAYHQSNR